MVVVVDVVAAVAVTVAVALAVDGVIVVVVIVAVAVVVVDVVMEFDSVLAPAADTVPQLLGCVLDLRENRFLVFGGSAMAGAHFMIMACSTAGRHI